MLRFPPSAHLGFAQALNRAGLFLAAAGLWLSIEGQADGDTISWGTNTGETFAQSDGSSFDSTFSFELGIFSEVSQGVDFSPNGGNTSLWNSFWKPFDVATDANGGYNVPASFVNRSTPLNENGTTPVSPYDAEGFDFFDQKAYVWVFNNKDGDTGSEWALYTDSTWAFPPSSTDSDPTIHPYRLTDADTVIFGGINSNSSNAGSRSSFPETFSIQTHAVPEPSIAMLLAIAAGMASFSRQRRKN